jgi:anti-sigma factor RsiW
VKALASARRLSGLRAATLISVISGLALLGGACGWLLRDQIAQRANELLRESAYMQTLLMAHQMFVRDPPSGVLLPPAEFSRLATQIDRQLGVTLSLPDQDDGSLVFRGGRLLPLGDEPAALLIFERDQGRVSLIVARDLFEGAQAAFNRSVQDTSISIAEQGGFQFGVVGQVSADEFELLKRILDGRSGRV